MAVSIDWGTSVISVGSADLTLIQSSPTEIRELNLNNFRLDLRALEAGSDGIGFLKTHNHNTEVTLAGLTFARVIEILDPYTVTFEDGQYAVNLVGANSNVADKVNVNQVSVRSQNSAGLISTPLIEFSSFEGGVWVDVTSSTSGTTFPAGTRLSPVNNLDDALVISNYRGFGIIYVVGDLTIDSGGDYSNLAFFGESISKTNITVSSAANVTNCEFSETTLTGTLDGNCKLKNCRVLDLDYIYGVIEQCIIGPGTITLGGSNEAHLLDCWSGTIGSGIPIIDCGGSGQNLALRNYNGGIKLINKTGSERAIIDLNSGEIELDSTITNGSIIIRGVGDLLNNSTGSTFIESSGLINLNNISDSIWDEATVDHTGTGTTGKALTDAGAAGNPWSSDMASNNTPGTFGEALNKIKKWVGWLRGLL